MRPTEWQILVRGLEGLKRFKTVILDVIHKWVIDFEKGFPNICPSLMPDSIRVTLETELGASTEEVRSGRHFIVFYPLGKLRSGSPLPSPEKEGVTDLTGP